ncbi:MAG TPA: hypothetical protein VHH73_01650 [Verrucomicrobiae bacterium]|nr:hypothetical protein [Verrucomicrobiae bacterium]
MQHLTKGDGHRARRDPSKGRVKTTLRGLEAPSQEALIAAPGKALDKITGQDAINWFAHCRWNFI